MIVRRASALNEAWFELRTALWPEPHAEHRSEMVLMLAQPERFAVFLAYEDGIGPIGFAEAAIRTDYVNGCKTTPVVFLEGIFVAEAHRRRGVARALCAAAADWGRSHGCTEFGSDALLENERSHAMHLSLGFTETRRVVYFCKSLLE